MKAGIFLTAALVQIAAAQPHRNAHHQHKRGAVTEVAYVTATANNVVVYVDQAGNPVTTSYKNAAPTPAPAAPAPAAPAPVAPAPAVQPAADNSDDEAQVQAKAAPAPAPAAPAAPEMDVHAQAQVMKKVHKKHQETKAPSGGKGITYSPYNADGTCKSQGQVSQDIGALSEYSLIRIYGTDCDQVNTVVNACKSSGKKIFAGVFDVNQVSSEIATMISGVNGNWDMIDTVSIGNELINAGSASAESLAGAIGVARGALKAAGYSGPVVTVDTFNALSNLGPNNVLCQASDYVAANCHAFFDPNTSASEAGDFVHGWYQKLSGLCPGKKAVITESGWPSQGSTNGQAVPSEANQQTAVSSIKNAFANDMDNLILFTAYNDEWKSKYNSASFFWAETSWGIYGDAPSA